MIAFSLLILFAVLFSVLPVLSYGLAAKYVLINKNFQNYFLKQFRQEARDFCKKEGILLTEGVAPGAIVTSDGEAYMEAAGLFTWKREGALGTYLGFSSPFIYIATSTAESEFFTLLHEIGHYLIEKDIVAMHVPFTLARSLQNEDAADIRGISWFFGNKSVQETYVFKISIDCRTDEKYKVRTPSIYSLKTLLWFFKTKRAIERNR